VVIVFQIVGVTMPYCGFPARFFGDNDQCRAMWFYAVLQRNHYDGREVNAEYSSDQWGDGPK
jgi:hypothetical protein